MDQAIDGGGREDEAAAKVADKRDMVGLCAIGRDNDKHADDDGDVKY